MYTLFILMTLLKPVLRIRNVLFQFKQVGTRHIEKLYIEKLVLIAFLKIIFIQINYLSVLVQL